MTLSACSDKNNEIHKQINVPRRLSFSWWGSEDRRSYTLSAVEQFEKMSDNVDIRTYSSDFKGYKENLDALMACGKNADVMQINYSWLSEYSPDGSGFYDLRQLDDIIDLDNYTDEQLALGECGGKLNAIPISLNAVTFYYNKTLLEQYGLAVPNSWEDILNCGQALKAEGKYLFETADVYLWLMLTAHEEQLSGRKMFDGGGFSQENYLSMMQFAQQLAENGVINYGSDYSRENFFNGSAAAELLWVSDAEYYVVPIEETGGRVIVGDYPVLENSTQKGWYVKPTSLYAISADTADPQEAARLVNFLLNDEHAVRLQGTEKGVPLSGSALETLSAEGLLNGVTFEASEMINESGTLELMPAELENEKIYQCFFEEFDRFYYGKKSIEQAAENFYLELDNLM